MRKLFLAMIASLALAVAACGPGADQQQPQQPMDPQPPAQPGDQGQPGTEPGVGDDGMGDDGMGDDGGVTAP
jgi:hypothetical protein